MAELTQQDVGDIVKQINELFIKRDPANPKIGIWCDPKVNTKIPDKLELGRIIKKLSDYTDEVQQAATEGVGGLAGVWLDVFGGGGSPGQWTLDMSHWRERLAGYQYAIDKAKGSGVPSCEPLRESVALPLIMGFYQADTPGITAPVGTQSVADVATPYILSNGIKTYHEFARENFERFKDDLAKEARKLLKRGISFGGKLAIALGVGAGAVLTYKLVESSQSKRP